VSSLWTPSGEHRPEEEPSTGAGPGTEAGPGMAAGEAGVSQEQLEEFLRFQAEITSIPAVDLVANHAFGLQQLAMMHLMQVPNPDGTVTEPRLEEAALAIDALSALVDTLGERLGPHHDDLRQAVTELRLAFVELSSPQ
jgi:hypothetical protein